jgi:hypothetical protein
MEFGAADNRLGCEGVMNPTLLFTDLCLHLVYLVTHSACWPNGGQTQCDAVQSTETLYLVGVCRSSIDSRDHRELQQGQLRNRSWTPCPKRELG